MHFYFVSDTTHRRYYPTLHDAHVGARQPMNLSDGTGFRRDWVKIELVDVPVDKAGVLALLNNEGGTERALRCWELTQRGGLVEVAVDADAHLAEAEAESKAALAKAGVTE